MGILVVVAPQKPDPVSSSNVPNCERRSFEVQGLDIEPDGRDSCDYFAELHAVEDGGFTRGVEAQDEAPKFSIADDLLVEFSERDTHSMFYKSQSICYFNRKILISQTNYLTNSIINFNLIFRVLNLYQLALDSNMSKSSGSTNPVEWTNMENQFIVRFPQDMANIINNYLESKGNEAQPSLTVQPFLQRDGDAERIAFNIELNSFKTTATLLELPTITETFQTIDRVNFFKSGDICEMLYVHDSKPAQNKAEGPRIPLQTARRVIQTRRINGEVRKIARYKSHSGVNPPTKYIKQRFYRKKPQVAIAEVREVEAELEEIRKEMMGAKPNNPMGDEESQTNQNSSGVTKVRAKRNYQKKFARLQPNSNRENSEIKEEEQEVKKEETL